MNSLNLKIWVEAARPKTLAAAFVPVLIGATIAFQDNLINWTATSVALLCAFLIQIGTNFANDYFDFVKGADTDERIGFERATSKGLISPKSMLNATILSMCLAFIFGLYLVWIGGTVVLAIGLLSLLFGVLYTGGPFPLGYNGLGDVFVFIFFGIVAVMTTYYVNALEWSIDSFWASLAVGALCTNILVVNNLRDVDQDKKAGKKTLGVLFGDTMLKIEYSLMLILAFAIPPHFYFQLHYDVWIFLPFLILPIAVLHAKTIWTETEKRNLNQQLEKTAKFMTLFGFLFSIGIIL
ncbi:MAG TPA: 1,4-dihydroxy-2-naphthoate octaprenyltransferase [Balneola sp.]|nr:1,4-dihydroxy-2-naphthoate octaprenyltransferase [Bacteroidota bacterium]MAC05708.1 1,4-dihydroxy-2-naphthoate octaprenyltransferase [Balneola sp.]MAO76604.1 1,4-dihydroxy-2-naphthoate octaprenyltransferase [Balneola sp.]MBF63726.1 1,4-dihydroxy-2-naphthoate octaprenyltransferase [Balneola sp.]HAH51922.1 1,4-dihydroxy-2-naphthoate octaprenyltransferase [Balneola sp.]